MCALSCCDTIWYRLQPRGFYSYIYITTGARCDTQHAYVRYVEYFIKAHFSFRIRRRSLGSAYDIYLRFSQNCTARRVASVANIGRTIMRILPLRKIRTRRFKIYGCVCVRVRATKTRCDFPRRIQYARRIVSRMVEESRALDQLINVTDTARAVITERCALQSGDGREEKGMRWTD